MYKIDLHTHSIASQDGSLTIKDYERKIKSGKLDYVAITDHNETKYAKKAQKILGNAVIVGEEIMTDSGEIIGLYLNQTIKPYQSLSNTVSQIKKQNGLVYIPHPLEKIRKGISLIDLEELGGQIDIIECYNSRSIGSLARNELQDWINKKEIKYSLAASSDSHGKIGFGKTMTIIKDIPSQDNLVKLLESAKYINKSASIFGRSYPTINRLKKRFKIKTNSNDQ